MYAPPLSTLAECAALAQRTQQLLDVQRQQQRVQQSLQRLARDLQAGSAATSAQLKQVSIVLRASECCVCSGSLQRLARDFQASNIATSA